MFQMVLDSIQKTMDVIAPPMDMETDFKYHCDMIKNYFTNEQNLNEINSKLVEDTPLPKHFHEIMRLLIEENQQLFFSSAIQGSNQVDNESSSVSIQELNPTTVSGEQGQRILLSNTEITIGTLMECLLSNKVLEMIINAAKLDLPFGIRLHCYRFLIRLISEYRVNLLNHCSILNQINELISMCAINSAGPYEKAEIEFLSVIVKKIQMNYNLIHCFTRNDFPLLSSLITIVSSPDNEIADKAGQLLIELVSIIEEDVAKIILKRTLFKQKIVKNMIDHYKQIPSDINPEYVETVLNIHEESNENQPVVLSFQMRKFLIFFKWFSFIDQILIKCKSSSLIFNLLEAFHQDFLCNHFSQNMFGRSEINAQILSTILIFACLKHCKSNKLNELIIDYLLNEQKTDGNLIAQVEDRSTDQPQQRQCSDEIGLLNRRQMLINRCRIRVFDNVDHQFLFKLNLSDHYERGVYNSYLLSLYTLQLFEEILTHNMTKQLFEELFISNLINRTYLDIAKYNISNDLSELEELNMIGDLKLQLNEIPTIIESNEPEPSSKSLINNSAVKSIKYFVALIPNELKSCQSDFGFEPYIEEAQKRFDECLQVCENWKWPKEIKDDFNESTNNCNDEDFVENDFISMLFDNLSNIIQIPYELNLQITSLTTKLALFPHPNLNEFLLNPSLPLKENCRSLFSILHRVVDQLQVQVLNVNQLKAKLNVIRTFLLGETTDLNGYNVTNADQKILEAIIIIEEFGKELAAVAVVKNSYLL